MIITKLSGGLGNQLFQYAVGRAVAERHKVPLKFDITAYETYALHNGFRLDQFNINAAVAGPKEINELKGSDFFISKALRKSGLKNKKTFYAEKERTVYDPQVFASPARYLEGYWQNEQYFLNIRETILQELRPRFSLSVNARDYQDSILNNNAVSIHVRRGDYFKHPEIGVLDVAYYKNGVEYIENRVGSPKFFIFSDDLEWCKANLKFIPKPIFVEGTETEIDDLILMSHCKHNIVANSSFSWWGAWLNKNEAKLVIAPKEWLAINPNGYKWAPRGWIEISKVQKKA